jgi:RNA-directed DNA polymerase
VRFLSATRLVVGLEYEPDARRFWDALRARLEEFALALYPDKTRLIEFGRSARDRRASAGLGKPETFKFLGFAFICSKSRRGQFIVHRKSRRDRMQANLKEVKKELRKRIASADSRAGQGLLCLSRGSHEPHEYQCFPPLRDTALAPHASAA